jgi:hypothetical protein
MEIKKKVILRAVADEYILVPVGDTVMEYNGIFIMTESARLLWDAINDGKEREELPDVLLGECEIDRATAEADSEEFLERLSSYGII